MIIKGDDLICVCNHGGCNKAKRSSSDIAWKMREITFGVHPAIVSKIYREKKEPTVIVKHSYHFCEEHRDFYQNLILALIAKEVPYEIEKICTDADFKEDLGCWITIIDVLGGHSPQNFQISYEILAKIFTGFHSIQIVLSANNYWISERVKKLKNLFI